MSGLPCILMRTMCSCNSLSNYTPATRLPHPNSLTLPRQAKSCGAWCYAQVAAVYAENVSVWLAVVLPDALWQPYPAWRANAQAGALFARLAPPALQQQADGRAGQLVQLDVRAGEGSPSSICQQPQAGQPQQVTEQHRLPQHGELLRQPSYMDQLQAALLGVKKLDAGQDAFRWTLLLPCTMPGPPVRCQRCPTATLACPAMRLHVHTGCCLLNSLPRRPLQPAGVLPCAARQGHAARPATPAGSRPFKAQPACTGELRLSLSLSLALA